jgi:hypothetical protein
MNDQQIAAVLTYVRQAWGNNAGPVDEKIVTAARQATASRKAPWTVAELEKEPKEDPTPKVVEPGKPATEAAKPK